MQRTIIGGLEADVAQKYVILYERITHITGEICSLGKAIEVVSMHSDSDIEFLSNLGSLINEKSEEICLLIDDFVSYPTIYLALRDENKENKS